MPIPMVRVTPTGSSEPNATPEAVAACKWHSGRMSSQTPSYRGYRFPPEIISHAVWLYHRFSLSFRDAEDLLAQRGVTVTYETIRQWCLTFGPAYARTLRRRRGRVGGEFVRIRDSVVKGGAKLDHRGGGKLDHLVVGRSD